jgi:hypothetical protein
VYPPRDYNILFFHSCLALSWICPFHCYACFYTINRISTYILQTFNSTVLHVSNFYIDNILYKLYNFLLKLMFLWFIHVDNCSYNSFILGYYVKHFVWKYYNLFIQFAFFLVVLGFELWASCLLGRLSATWTMPLTLFCFSCFSGSVLCFHPGWTKPRSSSLQPPE